MDKLRKVNKKSKTVHVIENGKLYLMCEDCFNLYPIEQQFEANTKIKSKYAITAEPSELVYFKSKCNFCNIEDPILIELDYNIAEIISNLNKLGCRTAYCCEGHKGGSSNGYIMFSDNKFLKMAQKLKNWRVENIDSNRLRIVYDIDKKTAALDEMKRAISVLMMYQNGEIGYY